MPEVWHILEQSAAPLTLELYERALGAIVQHMPVDPAKTRRLSVNVPLELAEKVEALAAKERRSVASWLRNCVEDAIESSESHPLSATMRATAGGGSLNIT